MFITLENQKNILKYMILSYFITMRFFLMIKLFKKFPFIFLLVIMILGFTTKSGLQSRNIQGSAYDFSFKSIDGENLPLSQFKGNPILLFNSASKCGFTSQYTGLQKIHQQYKNKGLIVIGVPSDNFNQEPGTEKEIKEFCRVNFNITFHLTKKNNVIGKNAHPIFQWINENYDARPKWNFFKFLINKEGKLEKYFSSMTAPSSPKLINTIETLIN